MPNKIINYPSPRPFLICLSPSYVSCVKAIMNSLLIFFFHCSYASRFWHIVLEAFDRSLACSDNNSSLLLGHTFHDTKKIIWLANIQAFFWTLWDEHNKRLSRVSFSAVDNFIDLALSTAKNSMGLFVMVIWGFPLIHLLNEMFFI